jgi:hypothetical protein
MWWAFSSSDHVAVAIGGAGTTMVLSHGPNPMQLRP